MRSTRPFLVGVPAFFSATLMIALPLGAADFQILHSFDLPPGNVQAGLTQVDGLWYGASYTGGAFDQGSIFAVMPDGSTRVLHSFTGPDGARPAGRPVWVASAPDGAALYGTTAFGGAANRGTLYRISLDGVFTSLYSFGVGAGALQACYAGLTPEGDYLYGTATYGGANGGTTGYGGVFRLNVPTGTVEVVHSFTGGLDGGYSRAELVPGPGGLYGVTYGGGGAPGGGVFRVATQQAGAPVSPVLAITSAEGNWLGYYAVDLAWAGGYLYVATAWAGGTLFRFDPLSPSPMSTVQLVHDFRLNQWTETYETTALAVDGQGNVLGTTRYGGSDFAGGVYRVSPQEGALPTYQEVAFFHRAVEGSPSNARLVMAADGSFYGVSTGTAAGERGAVYRFDGSSLSVVASLGVTTEGYGPREPTLSPDGRMFGVARWGGQGGWGHAFALDGGSLPMGLLPLGSIEATRDQQQSGYVPNAAALVDGGDGLYYTVIETGGDTNAGALLRVSPTEERVDVVHSLVSASDGHRPRGLSRGSDGWLYGATLTGGTYEGGTVFRFQPSTGTFETLYHFKGGTYPNGGLLVTGDKVYGTTYYACLGDAKHECWDPYGTVFELTLPTAGTPAVLTTLHTFTGPPDDGAWPQSGLVLTPNGLFGTTTYGGVGNKGAVYRIGPDGAYSVTYSFVGNGDGCQPLAGLTASSDGRLYGTTVGSYGCYDTPTRFGNVFVLDANGGAASSLHTFSGPDGWYLDTGVVLTDGDSQLLGATMMGGPGSGGVLYRIVLGMKPTASAGGPYTVTEGGTVSLAATGKDNSGGPVTFAWDLDGDGAFDDAVGRVVDFAVPPDWDGPKNYPVSVRVTTETGIFADASSEVTVTNVSPVVHAGGDVVLAPDQPLGRAGSFDDPGPDAWAATVDYGDGSGPVALPLSGRTFALAHSYTAAGTYTVTVTVTDDDGAVGAGTFVVVAKTAESATRDLIGEIEDLVDAGTLRGGQGGSLLVKLRQALGALQAGDTAKAVTMLESFVREVAAFERAGILDSSKAAELIGIAEAVIDSVGH